MSGVSGEDRRLPDEETGPPGEVETPDGETERVTPSPDGPPSADEHETAHQAADPRASDLALPDPTADESLPTARRVARKPAAAEGQRADADADASSAAVSDGAPGAEAGGDATAEAEGEARPPMPRLAPELADGDEATPATRPAAASRLGVGLSGVLPPPLAPPEGAPGTGDQPSDVDSARTGPRRSILARTLGVTPAGLLIGLLVGLLGFGLVVQLRSNTASNGLAAARQEDLVRILDDLSSREERLRRQIALLEAARNRLSTTGDRDAAALEEAMSRSTALGILAGTLPAQGPGIELRMTDPGGRLRAEDMLDAVEELRAAGAEAIQVGSVRIGLDSAFTDSDEGLRVDGRALQSPYVVLAIGDPATLATALNIPGGVVDSTRAAGGEATIAQRHRLVIRALRPLPGHDYARPADDGD
jgi:uncharacterized protein YlxW (UPF0749 family)